MHEIDLQLLKDAREIVKHNFKEDTKLKILRALADYSLAAKLSRGPDVNRSKYWAEVANVRKIKLQYLLNQTMSGVK